MWIQSGYEGGARWRADGLRAIGVFEDKALVGEGIHVRRLDPVVAVTRHGVGALLVGDEEQNVGVTLHVSLSILDAEGWQEQSRGNICQIG